MVRQLGGRWASYSHPIVSIVNFEAQAIAYDAFHKQWMGLITDFEDIVLID